MLFFIAYQYKLRQAHPFVRKADKLGDKINNRDEKISFTTVNLYIR